MKKNTDHAVALFGQENLRAGKIWSKKEFVKVLKLHSLSKCLIGELSSDPLLSNRVRRHLDCMIKAIFEAGRIQVADDSLGEFDEMMICGARSCGYEHCVACSMVSARDYIDNVHESIEFFKRIHKTQNIKIFHLTISAPSSLRHKGDLVAQATEDAAIVSALKGKVATSLRSSLKRQTVPSRKYDKNNPSFIFFSNRIELVVKDLNRLHPHFHLIHIVNCDDFLVDSDGKSMAEVVYERVQKKFNISESQKKLEVKIGDERIEIRPGRLVKFTEVLEVNEYLRKAAMGFSTENKQTDLLGDNFHTQSSDSLYLIDLLRLIEGGHPRSESMIDFFHHIVKFYARRNARKNNNKMGVNGISAENYQENLRKHQARISFSMRARVQDASDLQDPLAYLDLLA